MLIKRKTISKDLIKKGWASEKVLFHYKKSAFIDQNSFSIYLNEFLIPYVVEKRERFKKKKIIQEV